MALHLLVSNSLNVLANHLCTDLEQQELDVFKPVFIITQTDGMNTWLKQQVAKQLGIAANYRYLKSQELINQVYYLLGGRTSEILSSENLSWIIYKLLGEPLFIETFKDVSNYYTGSTADNEVKKMSLAEKIADLFDQYQIYRPEMIAEWNQQTSTGITNDWQQYLWTKARQLLEDKLPDKTNISKFIIDELKDTEQQQKLQTKMPVVYLFGLSITTGYHLQLYHTLGQYIDLKFHFINPAPGQYWFEDVSEKQLLILKRKGFADKDDQPIGNPLLTSWGKVLQDTYGLLFQDETLLNAYEEVEAAMPDDNKTLLQKIQYDLFLNTPTASNFSIEDCKDGSITINSCFSAAREVEVLYNYLVQLASQPHHNISPRDIVVMVSDINTYTPYIKAIFDNAPYKFRYSITDDSYVTGDTASAALKALLSISEEHFTAENIVQLLDSAHIRKRFNITETGLIRDVVNKANIRFGIENNLEDESIYVSWIYGLKRMMYGICMSGEEEYGNGAESFYPLDIVEGSQSMELIKFNHFISILIESLKERTESRTIKEWVEYVQRLLDNMICEPENTTDEDYLSLIKQLGAYNILNDYFTEKISFRVFSHRFLKMLHTNTGSGSFASSGITFCSLIPMRSIPFKVVAMLGINFDKFPRKESAISFNKMEKQKRKGDRNVKENDKHLFLETILSAEEYFYISYVGQSAKDNTPLPPSTLIDELLDYIQSGANQIENVRNLLIKKHPLHGFSKKYNQNDGALVTYLNSAKPMEAGIIDRDKISDQLSFNEIELSSLIGFFKNSFKGYYNNVLKIYYREDDELLEENELFELDTLQQWELKNQLLVSEEEEPESLRTQLVKKGKLPLKNIGTVSLQKIENEIAITKFIFKNRINNSVAITVPIEINLENSLLKGTLNNIYENNLMAICFSKNECKCLLEAYIKYLAARASGFPYKLYYISAKKNIEFEASPISKEKAIERLQALVDLYKTGHEKILAFYPSFKITPDKIETLNIEEFQKAIKNELDNYKFPCNDNYILNEFKKGYFSEENVLEWYKSNCMLLLKPLAEVFTGFYTD